LTNVEGEFHVNMEFIYIALKVTFALYDARIV